MGRLSHLQQTLPISLSHENVEVILVDYSCPELCREWAKQTFPSEIQSGKLKVIHVPGKNTFHPSHAKNVAHVHAQGQILINADADNFIDDTYLAKCVDIFDNKLLDLIFPALWDVKTACSGMVGRIAIRRQVFHALGGYDEEMNGWGQEDHDLVGRTIAMGLGTATIAHEFLNVIEHDNTLRVRFSTIKNIFDSASLNTEISRKNLLSGKLVANGDLIIGCI